jgi:mono/diheme cytochrome c family protein
MKIIFKRILKIAMMVVAGIVTLLGLFCLYVAITGVPVYDRPSVPKIAVKSSPNRVARGEVIAQLQCMGCHGNDKNQLTGKHLTDIPSIFGKVFSRNITQDPEKGIGKWTDGELIYFLRTGLRGDGTYAPVMPQYGHMADEDMQSLVSWLRSDRFPVQSNSEEPQNSDLSLLSKVLTHTLLKPLPYPQNFIALPDSADPVALGKYTADALGDCFSCHSADLVDQDKVTPENTKGYYGGGAELVGEGGEPIISANLTFDEETGIARKYSKEQFVKAVKLGVRPDGSILRKPMTPKTMLSDAEVGAIYEYLKTIPKIHNEKTVGDNRVFGKL